MDHAGFAGNRTGRNAKSTVWTKAAEKTLEKLWPWQSAQEIADILGYPFTRGAVVGKATRMHLRKHPSLNYGRPLGRPRSDPGAQNKYHGTFENGMLHKDTPYWVGREPKIRAPEAIGRKCECGYLALRNTTRCYGCAYGVAA